MGRIRIVPRVSSKENKNIYFKQREKLGLTRETASDLLETIAPERIEKIENERCEPHPDEVLVMSEKYKSPELCNYYCSNQCPIGRQYVPEVKIQNLSQIVLRLVDSLNTVQDNQRRLIGITADGTIDDSEINDFVDIQNALEKFLLQWKHCSFGRSRWLQMELLIWKNMRQVKIENNIMLWRLFRKRKGAIILLILVK